MIGKGRIGFLLLVAVLFFISACNISEEDIQLHAKESFEEKIAEENKREITYIGEDIQFYLPESAEVEKIDDYNILIENGEELYLLFTHESFSVENKKELLDALMIEEDPFILEMNEKNGELAYFLVIESEEGEYTAIVGYDHFKMTTMTELEELSEHVEVMFDIVRSAQLK